MISKEVKPNLNALNCVSLYKHEASAADARSTAGRSERIARHPRKTGFTGGLLGLNMKKKSPSSPMKMDFVAMWNRFQQQREVSPVDLAVAFGFLAIFSAAATVGMIVAMG